MAEETLTSSIPSYTFDTTAGADYVIGITGHLGQCRVKLEFANTTTPTIFTDLMDPLGSGAALEFRAVGSKLRATLLGELGIPATAAVNVEVTAVS